MIFSLLSHVGQLSPGMVFSIVKPSNPCSPPTVSPSQRSKKSGKDSNLQLKQTIKCKPMFWGEWLWNSVSMSWMITTSIWPVIGKCIRINDVINALFHRLHIIYFRSWASRSYHWRIILTENIENWTSYLPFNTRFAQAMSEEVLSSLYICSNARNLQNSRWTASLWRSITNGSCSQSYAWRKYWHRVGWTAHQCMG